MSKASISTLLLHGVNGDIIDATAWFFVETGMPVSLMDIESSFIDEGPGLRILTGSDGKLRVELKWADKPTYRSDAVLPVGRWTQLRLRFKLDSGMDGTVQLWLDDELVIEATGQTLALPDTIIDRFEIGITANNADGPVVVFVDDVSIRTTRGDHEA